MASKKKAKRNGTSKSRSMAALLRQHRFPIEFRIPESVASEAADREPESAPLPAPIPAPAAAAAQPRADAASATEAEWIASSLVVAELATALWYVKTKHFKKKWADESGTEEDARIRRTLSRISRASEALRKFRVEVSDPAGRPYQPGSEGLMRPIQFLPTPGITSDRVSETVTPIIYRDDRIIQRGEVFVSVAESAPEDSGSPPSTPEAPSGPPPAAPPGVAAGPP